MSESKNLRINIEPTESSTGNTVSITSGDHKIVTWTNLHGIRSEARAREDLVDMLNAAPWWFTKGVLRGLNTTILRRMDSA